MADHRPKSPCEEQRRKSPLSLSAQADRRRLRRTAATSVAVALALMMGAPFALAQNETPASPSPAVPTDTDEPAFSTAPTASEPMPSSPAFTATVTLPPTPLVLPPLARPPLPSVVTVRPRPHPPARKPVPPRPVVTESLVHYGHSSQGRPLTAYVLDNGTHPDSDTTLIFGGFHGNERTTPALVSQLRQYLKQKPDAWPGRRVVLVPVANPDGWNAGTRVNAHNVDLNRNFPSDWSCTGVAARNNPGPAPASEPETRAMIHLLALYHPAKVVSLHSPLHCLNWTGPVGLAMAEAMRRYDHYHPTAHIGYPTPGSLGDYCGSLGIGIVTLELPQEAEAASWLTNRDALVSAIQLPGSGAQAVSKSVNGKRRTG